jgi:hypothetical protein
MAREDEARRPCCMISEMLEESGVDREKVRQLRRQVLEGMILLCRWQLERMDAWEKGARAAARESGRRDGRKSPRKVTIE